MQISHFTELRVYERALAFAGKIFALSANWPGEERFALTDQIRRSSRAIGANIAEAWAKRRYEAHFISKLTDADGENHESEHWLICARDCGYLTSDAFAALLHEKQEIGRMLGAMLQHPESFLQK